MDSSQHALHTNGKFFYFFISKSFFDLNTLFKNNSGVVGLGMRGVGGTSADQPAF